MQFTEFEIHPSFAAILQREGITTATPVQQAAIPIALDGADLTAIAQTGTGKTLAFGLPALTRLSKSKRGRSRMLVLAPTRELAQQVERSLQPLAKAIRLRTTCLVGGAGFGRQTDELRRGADIVVATPGRLIDHMERGNLNLRELKILVLDEADRMLDMGFLPDIRRILKNASNDRQTLLFSATFPREIERLAKDFQVEPERVTIGSVSSPAETINQTLYTVKMAEKRDLLVKLLQEPGMHSVLVFIRTKHGTDRVAKHLRKSGIQAEPIHGGRTQGQRERTLDHFRKGKFGVLVATDVAARGLDVQGITHVVNFDLPRTFEDYVHRIGRTGRASTTGQALSFATPECKKELRIVESGLGRALERVEWDGSVSVVTDSPGRPKPQARNSNRRTSGPQQRKSQEQGRRQQQRNGQPERTGSSQGERPGSGRRRTKRPGVRTARA